MYGMQLARPGGVTILAVLEFLGGISSLLAGFSELQAGSYLTSLGYTGSDTIFYALGSISTVFGFIALIVGYGLFRGISWAWLLAIIFGIISIVYSIILAVEIPISAIGAAVSVVVYLLIIYYLNRPHVKQFFGRVPSQAQPSPLPPPPSQ